MNTNKLLSYIFKYYRFSKPVADIIIKKLPANWNDNEHDNLYHYAAAFHQLPFLLCAADNESDINQFNDKGFAPLHSMIAACFLHKDKKFDYIQTHFNFPYVLAKLLLQHGANPNLKSSYNFINEGDYVMSKLNIMGTPLEMLVSQFWDNIVKHANREDMNNYKNMLQQYYNAYELLSNSGANIMISNREDFSDNTSNPPLKNAAHHFLGFLDNVFDIDVVLPILKDKNICFKTKDSSGNTLLHILLARIGARLHVLKDEGALLLIDTAIENDNCVIEDFYIPNNYNNNPLEILKWDAQKFAIYIETSFLKNKLEKELPINGKPQRRMKI